MNFDDLWRFIVNRSQGFPTVQEYHELAHIFGLMRGCESYLEIGTAEGNSLYVLAHALKAGARIVCLDLCEKHTAAPQADIVARLDKYNVSVCAGDSRNPDTLLFKMPYDCVLIDGGHDYQTVISDAHMYGKLATKYIFFHDVCLPEVDRAFQEYAKTIGGNAYKMINSTGFGYGIIGVK